jgi:ABC-type lipoprotein release transport system permease subunit
MENAIVPDYPVKMIFSDFIFIGLVIMAITGAIAWIPARAASKSVEARAL